MSFDFVIPTKSQWRAVEFGEGVHLARVTRVDPMAVRLVAPEIEQLNDEVQVIVARRAADLAVGDACLITFVSGDPDRIIVLDGY